MQDKMIADLATLKELTDEAATASKAGEPVKVARACIAAMLNKLDPNKETLGSFLNPLMADESERETALLFANLVEQGRQVLGKLDPTSAGGFDLSAGDAIATRFQMAVDGAWLEGEEADTVLAAVEAWKAARPTSKSSGGGGTRGTGEGTPDLGFTVAITCTDCKEVVSRSGKDNLNSIRDLARKHHGAKHGGKFGKGDAQFDAITDALKKVMGKVEGVSSVSEAAIKYTVSRATAE